MSQTGIFLDMTHQLEGGGEWEIGSGVRIGNREGGHRKRGKRSSRNFGEIQLLEEHVRPVLVKLRGNAIKGKYIPGQVFVKRERGKYGKGRGVHRRDRIFHNKRGRGSTINNGGNIRWDLRWGEIVLVTWEREIKGRGDESLVS